MTLKEPEERTYLITKSSFNPLKFSDKVVYEQIRTGKGGEKVFR